MRNRKTINSLTIYKVERIIEEILESIASDSLASDFLAPVGYKCIVELCNNDGRSKHRNSPIKHWNPDLDEIRIYFEKIEPQVDIINMEECVQEFCNALADAELKNHEFISLTLFRDTILPSKDLYWSHNRHTRQTVLLEAIQTGKVTTYKVPNPNNEDFPTTAIKLNFE